MSLLTELVVETGRRSYKHSIPSGLLEQLLRRRRPGAWIHRHNSLRLPTVTRDASSRRMARE